MNEHVLDRAVFAPQVYGIVAETFPMQELRPDRVEDVAPDVELSKVVANVLLGRVAEQLQLSRVRPQDGAVRPHPL